MKTTPKKNGGFTLVELIVVIAILAILAAVAIPAYSGYIAKAEEANDLQLLGALNTAFNAACVENGVSILDMDNATNGGAGSAEFVLSNGLITKLKVPGASASVMATAFTADQAQAILDSFMLYFGDNKDTPFKVYVQIVFADGAFEGYTADEVATVKDNGDGTYTITTQSGKSVTIKKEDKDGFNGSIFSTGMESTILLGKVDDVTSFAAEMINSNPDSLVATLFQKTEFQEAYYTALGLTAGTDEADAAMEEIMRQIGKNKGWSDERIQNAIDCVDESATADNDLLFNQIQANNAVLFAAQNTPDAADGILGVLTGGQAQSTIGTNLTTNDPGLGMAQAALAYGLYTAYAQRTDGVEMPEDPTDVLGLLNNGGFQGYLATKEAEADLAGYLAAMNMINQNATGDIAEDVLVNGFNTTDLNGLLNGAKK